MAFFDKFYKNLFPTFMDEVQQSETFTKERVNYSRTHTSLPLANITETNEWFEVEMAIPGIKLEELIIHCSDHWITVSSDREFNDYESDFIYSRLEFSYQTFCRTFKLPKNILTEDNLIINYDNGILYLKLAKCNKKQALGMKGVSVA